jgi:RimJ/RimL family protein N-acetyltransferase
VSTDVDQPQRFTPIAGERVRLAPLGLEAAETLRGWVNDPDTRHMSGGAAYQISLAAEEEWLRGRQEISWKNGICLGIEALDVPGAPMLIGNIELRHLHAEARSGNVGMLIGPPEYRGRGYGSEALRLLCRFAFDELDLHRVDLAVFDFNVRAQRAYLKVGFVEEGRRRDAVYLAGRYYDELVMGLLRDDFEAAEAARGAHV